MWKEVVADRECVWLGIVYGIGFSCVPNGIES